MSFPESGILVNSSTSSLAGQPQFFYQDAFQSKQFSGKEIQTVDSVLGRLVTVFLVRTVDTGSTTFTLLVPNVNLPPSNFSRHHHRGHHERCTNSRSLSRRWGRPRPIRSTSSPGQRVSSSSS
jgi:hypothetical protein